MLLDLYSTDLVFDPLVKVVVLGASNHLIKAGQPVSGTGITAGTTVVSYDESVPSITLSKTVNAELSNNEGSCQYHL